MKFKKLILLFIMLTISVFSFNVVKADFGPKPSMTVEVIGMNEPYHFALLMQNSGHNGFGVLDQTEFENQIFYSYYDTPNYPAVLNGFEDQDGYISFSLYTFMPHGVSQPSDNPNEFYTGYHPPQTFKIALVTSDNTIIISKVIEKTLYDAKFTFDVTSGNVESMTAGGVYQDIGVAKEIFPGIKMILEFLFTVLMTLLIELGVLWIFNYRDKYSFKLVTIVNVITQSILYGIIVVVSNFRDPLFTPMIILFLGEIAVLIIEISAYGVYLREKTKGIAILYAIIANLISFGFGFIFWIIAGMV